MEADEEPEEDLEEEWLADGTTDTPLPRKLEKTIRRRASATPPPSRRVTLTELIEQLEVMATAMANPPSRPRRSRPRPHSKRQAVRAIAQLAHQENLSEIAATLEAFLTQYWQDQATSEAWIDFEELLSLWPCPSPGPAQQPSLFDSAFDPAPSDSPAAHADSATPHQSDRVGVFWALLFLSAQSKVELSQEEFYGGLKVRHLDLAAESHAANAANGNTPNSVLESAAPSE
jgi:segregation and condensation protein A